MYLSCLTLEPRAETEAEECAPHGDDAALSGGQTTLQKRKTAKNQQLCGTATKRSVTQRLCYLTYHH